MGTDYFSSAIAWVNKYDITTANLLHRGVLVSRSKQQVIFPWYNDEGNLVLWQSRNFWEGARSKATTHGSVNACLPIYRRLENEGDPGLLVIVEDPLSAIKTARTADSMPCLGSDINMAKLARLRGLYDRFVVWLDGDMYDRGQRIARRLEMMGAEAKVIWTELDPKEYDDVTILDIVY